jgi:cold shock CspA family protein
MDVPVEIAWRDVPKTDVVEDEIHAGIEKLEDVCDHVTSCRVAIERPHAHPDSGNPYRIRVLARIPPGHELVATKDETDELTKGGLAALVRDAFDVLSRQARDLSAQQRGEVKHHPEQAPNAIVARMHAEEDYGFAKTLDGRDVYFHRNSVLSGDFERLAVGTAVRLEFEPGREGLQATSLRVVDKPGVPPQATPEDPAPRDW